MAASVANASFSTTELMSEVDRWICERGLQGNDAVKSASLPTVNLCPTEAPIATKSTLPPTTQPPQMIVHETTNLFQIIES